MAKNNNLSDFLKDLADTIRAKTGKTSLINPQDFSDEINTLDTINNQSKAVEITSNGTTIVSPDSGYTGLNSVNIKTNITTSAHVEIELKPNDAGETIFSEDNRGNISRIVIHEGITTVGDYALKPEEYSINNFGYAYSPINDIILPNSLRNIGKQAFACLDIKASTITIPKNVISIGENAFTDSSIGENHGLIVFQGDIPEWEGDVEKNPFYGFYGDIGFGENCKIIGKKAFRGDITADIDVESFSTSKIEVIGDEAFLDNHSSIYLGDGKIVFPSTLKKIKKGAFARTNLGGPDMPEGEQKRWILDFTKCTSVSTMSDIQGFLEYEYEFLPHLDFENDSNYRFFSDGAENDLWKNCLSQILVPEIWLNYSPWNKEMYKDYVIAPGTQPPGEGGDEGDEGGESTETSTTTTPAPNSGTNE